MAQAQQRRLYKSSRERVLVGVAGGLAEYLEVDPVLVRAAFVLMVFAGGAGFLAYVVLAVIMPEAPVKGTSAPPPSPAGEAGSSGAAATPFPPAQRGRYVVGMVLIAVGVFFLAGAIFPWFAWGIIWPFIFIAAGVFLVWSHLRR